MNNFEKNDFEKGLLKYFTINQLNKIQSQIIGIAGAGGLGSNCAFNLVRSGFNKFYIYDFDKVDYSNLNRQFYFLEQVGLPKVEALAVNLKKINPDIAVFAQEIEINEDNILGLFEKCSIVVEAFDKAESKKMLAESFYDSQKLIVSASGLAGYGNADDVITRKIRDDFYLIGDMKSEAGGDLSPYSPGVNVAAAKQADVILKFVLDD
ncbi:MAG TPA: sulfur carrier protein ThiS adenylyltransferase ThiF [Spirochaetota bacterium]|jgi:sulfur carrier protein ThiS adenylyltransferase|nr:MAG: tRNA threonylcarbamoyladenosine dehydratase [Spirochaetes bacterium ADurb.Bin133]HNZ27278.1 sulfur carrier protein ThiS adenylyltransferase ThiF [Spirochaetota bacterium]HPY88695.1 sulfur carrier protein ThiS adenylyltransferase ThiF [Spirochaetota bacterium]